jgi:predicted lipid-binding transport protein (Tim44 family)
LRVKRLVRSFRDERALQVALLGGETPRPQPYKGDRQPPYTNVEHPDSGNLKRGTMMSFRFRSMFALAAVALTLAFAVTSDAAPRFNSGSRGSRTFSAPPPTATAPNAARPIERSMTQPGQPGSSVNRPATAANPAAATGGFFSRGGMLGGLAAGFLGAGLIGMLMGNGFLSGIAGFAGFLGLIIQVVLVVIVARLAWAWWKRRSQPTPAYARTSQSEGMNGPRPQNGAQNTSFFSGLGGGAAAANADSRPIEIQPDDYTAFEDTLRNVQAAYSKEDVNKLGDLVTPEMLSYYAEELAANASRGVRNEITDVQLQQGDLAEAWSEGGDDYATVAMRYQQKDTLVDRKTGNVVEGSDTPDEGIEYWTFRRARGGPWMVSAIQQTD